MKMVNSTTPKTRKTIFLLFCILCSSAFVFSFQDSSGNSPNPDAVFRKGKEEFFRELKLEFGLHPLKFRLLPECVKRIENAETDIPDIYENLVNIMYLKEGPDFDALIKNGSKNALKEFESRFIALSKQTAASFVRSLFVDKTTSSAGSEEFDPQDRNRLDLVLSSFQGRSSSCKKRGFLQSSNIPSIGVISSWGFRLSRFKKAHITTNGKGVKIGVISSGLGGESGLMNSGSVNLETSFSLISRKKPSWMEEKVSVDDDNGRGTVAASILASASPGSEIAIYKIIDDQKSGYAYWPAMQTAQAIYKAVYDGMDALLVTSVFDIDFEFLKEACQFAYEKNVIIVCPNGGYMDINPEKAHQFPAHYPTTIAVAGVVPDRRNAPVPWNRSGVSHYLSVAAPAFIGDFMKLQALDTASSVRDNTWAAAFTCGLVALLSSKIPKTGEELSGQYFQRIYEIMTHSADPRILGFKNFHAKTGYGLIDAEKSVGEGLQTYLEKMKSIEDNFKKRMAELEKREQEAENNE
ncbi:MAG: S8 family serine peptidase [Candidatus Aminicenantes bacterium]|nr:S8 family serine peptidase [Candidatus Aminicenantes bacterium]